METRQIAPISEAPHASYPSSGAGVSSLFATQTSDTPPALLSSTYIKEGDIVIDFGCDPGFITLAMTERVGERGRV